MAATKEKVLIVDDQVSVRFGLRKLLEAESYRVFEAEDGEKALAEVTENAPNLILLDLRLPDVDGLELLQKVKAIDDDVPVIILTAHGSIEKAVAALKASADNFLTKPFDADGLLILIAKTLEQSRARREQLLIGIAREQVASEYFVGESEAIGRVHSTIERLAQSDSTVLLQGETGTGKGMVARFIHKLSRRSEKPFVTINCAGLSRELLESELFGHEKGAFTSAHSSKPGLLELAHEGTFFFDEIAEMEPAIQAKLLNVLEQRRFRRVGGIQEKEVDVRIIAATNRNLQIEVKQNRFREDLYYRLSVMPLKLPPLRERTGDILPLAMHFIAQFNQKLSRQVKGLTQKAALMLENYEWPGNIRELRNIIERAIILCTSDQIHASDLPFVADNQKQVSYENKRDGEERFLTLDEMERGYIQRVLSAMGGNLSRTAEVLGITRATLYKKIRI
ncbi:MAG: sigma-54-dependent Fis family transcriptional regulator [Blastocatellia bacterium]|nr:sigma-54-dependent Fis family transcriptional regulator [Blastocatellia bacterium]